MVMSKASSSWSMIEGDLQKLQEKALPKTHADHISLVLLFIYNSLAFLSNLFRKYNNSKNNHKKKTTNIILEIVQKALAFEFNKILSLSLSLSLSMCMLYLQNWVWPSFLLGRTIILSTCEVTRNKETRTKRLCGIWRDDRTAWEWPQRLLH